MVHKKQIRKRMKEWAHKISSEIAKFYQKLPKLLPHVFETPTNTRTPSKRENVMKEYSFNLSTEIGVVEDCVAVILPP